MVKGKHLIIDLYDCDPVVLNDFDALKTIMQEALILSKANILRIIGEKFKPHGVTLLALLAESHCSIHTWPEIKYCAIDLYTCGENTDNAKAAEYLKEKLKSNCFEEKEIERSLSK